MQGGRSDLQGWGSTGIWWWKWVTQTKGGVWMWCGTANADPCQLTWSSKYVFLQNSSSSPNVTMTSITNGSAELHTKHHIFAASGGRISLIFLLWNLQTRGKNSWVCVRALSVCKSNVSTGDLKWHEFWGTNWDAQSSEVPSLLGSTSSQTSNNFIINKQEHSTEGS